MTIEDLALLFTRGIGARGAAALVDHFGSAEEVFAASKSELVSSISLREDIAERIVSGEGLRRAEKEVDYCRKHNIRMLASTDDDYPESLRQISDRPHVLFVQGDVEVLSMQSLSVVGTREATPAGTHACQLIIGSLAERVKELSIVSGLAYGIDSVAHRAALAAGAKTIAVLPSVLPSVTPAAHRNLADEIIHSGGALVSELHSETHQNGSFFISRNRIIAALSPGLLIVESPATGGSLSTADFADGYSRTVMALPGRITDTASFGSNNLIRTGKARLVLTADDIIEELGWQRHARVEQGKEECCEIELSAAEVAVLTALRESTTVEWDRLIISTGLSLGELSMTTMDLELKGLIRSLPGKRYELA
ncbi:MAG: DNA-processing protein DprA [Alistipes sp.]|nr:DNA-processing protein DprA [Alistipes sp.]